MEQMKQEQFITRRIGGTTYKVRVAFSETAVETMEEKILRMIRNEGVTNVGTYFKSIQTAGLTALNFQINVFLRLILLRADKITLFSSVFPLKQLHSNVQYAIIRKEN